MKKIRLLMPRPPSNWSIQNGPGIADTNDVYFLKDEPWLEIKLTSIEQCKKDGVIPWVRSAAGGARLEAERLEYPIILGPNVCFYDSNNPSINLPDLTSPYVHKLLMLDDINTAQAIALSTNPNNIRQVRHFMRPDLYEEPYFYKHKWDLFCSIKTGLKAQIVHAYQNHTAIHNGFYTFEELKYKAQHSKVCIHACHYETYGLTVHEISLLGCPIIYDNRGVKYKDFPKELGVEVSNVEMADVEELKEAVEKAASMDRKKVWEASREYQDPKKLLNIYRKALLE